MLIQRLFSLSYIARMGGLICHYKGWEWGVPVIIYGLFCYHFGNFDGRLSAE